MQQRQQLLPLFGRARRHGADQQRLAEQVFQLFDALGYRRLRDAEFLRGALEAALTDHRVQRLQRTIVWAFHRKDIP